MTLRLPRLPSNAPITDQQGLPTITFSSWWQSVVVAIETAFNNIAAAFAAAIAAQGSADAAQATATTAETTANAALTTANSKQDHSAKLDAYAGGDTPSAFTLGIVDSMDAAAWRAAIGAGTSSSSGTVTSVNVSGGTTGLTTSGGPVTGSGTITLGGTLGVSNGGTGVTTSTGSGSLVLSASPTFTGTVAIPTPTAGDNSTKAASTAFMVTALGAYAPLASPALTGTPTAPTATAGTNTTQLATTAFVNSALGGYVATPGAWTAYTPTITSGSGTITTATASGRWSKIGKTVFIFVSITITTNGTGAGTVIFTLPSPAQSLSVLPGRDVALTGKGVQAQLLGTGTTTASITFTGDNTYPGANGAQLLISGSYETP